MQQNHVPSIEEQAAEQLAGIGIWLHKLGLMEPYRHTVKARNSLLTILDEEFIQRNKRAIRRKNHE